MDAALVIKLLFLLLPTVPWVAVHAAVVVMSRHPLLSWGTRALSFGYGWLLWNVADGFMGDRFLSGAAESLETAWACAIGLLVVIEILAALRHARRAAREGRRQ